MLFAVIGAYISSSTNQNVPTGVSEITGFMGGILIIFGARLASGCTRLAHFHLSVNTSEYMECFSGCEILD